MQPTTGTRAKKFNAVKTAGGNWDVRDTRGESYTTCAMTEEQARRFVKVLHRIVRTNDDQPVSYNAAVMAQTELF